jgi:hypothetical protein
VAGRLGVGADGESERLVRVAVDAEGTVHGTRGTCRDDHQVRGPSPLAHLHADDPTLVDDRHRVVLPQQLGAGLLRQLHQSLVQTTAWPHRSVGRERGDAGPLELAHGAVGDHAQAVDAMGVLERHTELVQGLDRPGRESVAADLVPAASALLEDRDAGSCAGRPDRRGRTCGATTDHQDVSTFDAAHPPSLFARGAQCVGGGQ